MRSNEILMWNPNRRQWLVIWIAAPLAWLAYVLPGTDSLEEIETDLWSLILIVAALLVWKFADQPSAATARTTTRASGPQPPVKVLGWLLVIVLFGAILLRVNAVRNAVSDLIQPSDLSDVQSTLQEISDKLDK